MSTIYDRYFIRFFSNTNFCVYLENVQDKQPYITIHSLQAHKQVAHHSGRACVRSLEIELKVFNKSVMISELKSEYIYFP